MKRIRTEHGNVDPDEILGTGRFDFAAAQNSAGWKHELQHDHHHDPQEEHGVTSFVCERKRPFHPNRSARFLPELPDEIGRAKGFFWSAGREDVAMGVGKAGSSIRAGPSGQWLATVPEAERQQFFAVRPELEEEWGDRMTRLVFIGREFDDAGFVDDLDDRLLTDEEWERGEWSDYPDPFEPKEQRELALADD